MVDETKYLDPPQVVIALYEKNSDVPVWENIMDIHDMLSGIADALQHQGKTFEDLYGISLRQGAHHFTTTRMTAVCLNMLHISFHIPFYSYITKKKLNDEEIEAVYHRKPNIRLVPE